MGPVRPGRDRWLVFDTPRLRRPVAKGDPVHGRVRGALSVHRGVLRADFLHRAQNGAEVAGNGDEQPPAHDDDLQAVGRHGLLHAENAFQGARDIHRLGHRVQHSHGHVFDHRLEGTELLVPKRHRRRRQFVRPRGELLADILLRPQEVQATRPLSVVRSKRHHHASRVRGESEYYVFFFLYI